MPDAGLGGADAQARLPGDSPYRLLFQKNPLPMWVTDFESYRFLAVNEAALRHYGYSREEFLAMTVKDIRPPEDVAALVGFFADLKQNLPVQQVLSAGSWRHRKKSGAVIDVEVFLTPITFEGRLAQLVLVHDVSERKRAEETLRRQTKFLKLLQEVAMTANQASTVDEALTYCLERVCAHTGWELGHAYLLAPDSDDELAPTRLWYSADPERFAPFQRLSATIRFRKGVGLPGLVLASGRPQWLRDASEDERYPRKKTANQVGIRAAFGFPILIGTQTVGVLEFFLTRPKEPDEELLEIVAPIGAQIGRVIERSRAEAQLREREARLRLMTEKMPAVLWTTDAALRFTSSTGAALSGLGSVPDQVNGLTLMEYFQTRNPRLAPIAAHRRALRGSPETFEFIWKERLFQSHVEPLRDVGGKVVGCIGAALDITERRSAEEEVRRSREQFRELARRLQSIREEEQSRIAREIHDEFGQRLTALRLELAWLGRRLGGRRAGLRQRVDQMIESVDAAIDTLRGIAAQLRPPMLEDLGLSAAIEWLTQNFTQQTGIPCRWEGHLADRRIEPARAVAAFRIVQEALTNVTRHALAAHVTVSAREREGELVLVVRDDGRGITDRERRSAGSLGLAGMRERALSVGGKISIGRGDGGGTRVTLHVPLQTTSPVALSP